MDINIKIKTIQYLNITIIINSRIKYIKANLRNQIKIKIIIKMVSIITTKITYDSI